MALPKAQRRSIRGGRVGHTTWGMGGVGPAGGKHRFLRIVDADKHP
ncbi:MAG: hypothetical protein Q8Q00_08325 [Dehalococcoidia bacterium]|nr:hypothetical protein [Dehalococcoidia bacterium]